MQWATAVGLEKYNTEMRLENSKPRILNREANYSGYYDCSVGIQTFQIWEIHLGPIFATRNLVALFSNIQSSWANQYGSIDT